MTAISRGSGAGCDVSRPVLRPTSPTTPLPSASQPARHRHHEEPEHRSQSSKSSTARGTAHPSTATRTAAGKNQTNNEDKTRRTLTPGKEDGLSDDPETATKGTQQAETKRNDGGKEESQISRTETGKRATESATSRPPALRPFIGGDRGPRGSSLSSRAVASPEGSGEALPRRSGARPGVTVGAQGRAFWPTRGAGDAGGTRYYLIHLRVM